MSYLHKLLTLTISLTISAVLFAQGNTPENGQSSPDTETPSGMTVERLDFLLNQLDSNLTQEGPSWQLEFRNRPIIVVADGNADRMRIMSPVTESSGLDQAEMYRLLQANFDSALDARYAVAQDTLWSVFIHPLSPLDEQQLASAIAQVYNAANSFGTTYNSGAFTYGAGDSNGELLDELQKELDRLLSPTT